MRTALALGAVLLACWAGAVPVSSLRLVQGTVAYQPARTGAGSSTIRLEVRNDSTVPLEAMRLRMAFSRLPLTATAAPDWRVRPVPFAPPLEPGQTRTVTLRETGTRLHSRIEITRLFPLLQLSVRGKLLPTAVAPYLWQGSVYGPVGETARALGWQTAWSETWAVGSILSPAHATLIQQNSPYAVIDGRLNRLPGTVRLVRGNLVGPLALVFRGMGLGVEYDEGLNILHIDPPPEPPSPAQS